MHVMHVVGARPNFMKLGPVHRALSEAARQTIVHTGQHYDPLMSDIFFDQLGIPAPDANLQVGSKSHAEQTGQIMIDSLVRLFPMTDPAGVRQRLNLDGPFVLVTLHRPSNVDDSAALRDILCALADISQRATVVFPVHPRTRARILEFGMELPPDL